jgi:tetratricopeptide (TPR) repeat protein
MLRPNRARRFAAPLLATAVGVVASLPCRDCAQAPAQSLPQQATPAAPAAISSPPPSPVELGDTLAFHKRYQAAIAAYEKAPQRSADIWNKMGISYQMMFNFKEAGHCYKESLKLNPKDPAVFNNLGTVYESMEDYGQATRMYRKAIQLNSKFALGYRNLATSLMAQHKYKQGRIADERALALDPSIFDPSNSLTIDNPASKRERGAMNYYMAVDCARAGQTACALEHLRMALNQGFTSASKVATDRNFAALTSDPGFQQLLAEQTHK